MKELISECVCGKSEFLNFNIFGDKLKKIDIKECLFCGIKHQFVGITYEEYMNQYKEVYSCFEGKDGGQLTSQERYDHDYQLAGKRFEVYKEFISEGSYLLDIGSGNGAFVDFMVNFGRCEAKSLESCENYKGHKIDYRGDFLEIDLSRCRFNVVTMHDVLEHFVDPLKALIKCNKILEDKGILIIDFPDFFHSEGLHHWKYMEHLWMFSEYQLRRLLLECGFSIIDIKKPISSKLVFYAAKTQA